VLKQVRYQAQMHIKSVTPRYAFLRSQEFNTLLAGMGVVPLKSERYSSWRSEFRLQNCRWDIQTLLSPIWEGKF